MKLWINKFTPLLVLPTDRRKYFDLNPGTLVDQEIPGHAAQPGLTEVRYTNSEGKATVGWINSDHLEPYHETLPKNCVKIPNQTANPNDFEQYMVWDGQKVVNACGELAVTFCLNKPFEDVVNGWALKYPNIWKRVKGQGKWAGTSDQDLITLFAAHGRESVSLSTVMKRYTMNGLVELLRQGQIIVSCNIGYDGRFVGSNILHWCVVTAVHPERQWGLIDVYNPAPNRIEQYSWGEFLNSCHQPYGVYVPDPEEHAK